MLDDTQHRTFSLLSFFLFRSSPTHHRRSVRKISDKYVMFDSFSANAPFERSPSQRSKDL